MVVGQQAPVKPAAVHLGFDEHCRLQQSKKTPAVVGQQSPVKPSATHNEFEAQDLPLTIGPLVGFRTGALVGFLTGAGTGALVGFLVGTFVGRRVTGATGFDVTGFVLSQQFKYTPERVGQQFPDNPLHLGFAEHRRFHADVDRII